MKNLLLAAMRKWDLSTICIQKQKEEIFSLPRLKTTKTGYTWNGSCHPKEERGTSSRNKMCLSLWKDYGLSV